MIFGNFMQTLIVKKHYLITLKSPFCENSIQLSQNRQKSLDWNVVEGSKTARYFHIHITPIFWINPSPAKTLKKPILWQNFWKSYKKSNFVGEPGGDSSRISLLMSRMVHNFRTQTIVELVLLSSKNVQHCWVIAEILLSPHKKCFIEMLSLCCIIKVATLLALCQNKCSALRCQSGSIFVHFLKVLTYFW